MTENITPTKAEAELESNKNQQKIKISLSSVFSYLGALFVLAGISLFLAENFSHFSFVTQVLVVFGIGLASYSISCLLSLKQYTYVACGLYIIFSFCMPLGIGLVLAHMNPTLDEHKAILIIAGLTFAAHAFSAFAFQADKILRVFIQVFLLFSMSFLLSDLINWIFFLPFSSIEALGIFILLCGFFVFRPFSRQESAYWIGAPILLIPMWFTYLGSNNSTTWQLCLFPATTLLLIALSSFLGTWTLALWGMLGLVSYIFWLSYEKLAQVVGWPICLIIFGFIVMSLGYLVVFIKQKKIALPWKKAVKAPPQDAM